jgi:acyl carrier protein
MDQDEVIRRFVAKYNDCQEHSYQITRWPDKEERNTRACDAYAEAAGAGPLAIEHTNIETFYNQKLDSARFVKILGELEAELKTAFASNVLLTVPTFAIQPGTNWQNIKAALREWLLKNVPTLPVGRTDHNIAGVPFRVSINKDDELRSWFGVARWEPPGLDRNELVESIAAALADKNNQLQRYRTAGAETILILESQDIALVSPASLYKAFLRASERVTTPNIDQVWIAETYDPENCCQLECYLASEAIMDRANPENFMFGPRYAEYWAEAMLRE